MPQRTRVYPVYTRVSYLVYGLMLSIGVFFAGCLLAYMVRFVLVPQEEFSPPIPRLLWLNTGILLLGSHLLWRAWAQVRRERQSRFRFYLAASLLLGGLFCVLQTVGMAQLLSQHQMTAMHKAGGIASVLLLIFVHIAHFLAGYIALWYVTVQAYKGRYDHEYHNGVRLAALYWRFLDVLWLIMLLLFWLASGGMW